MFGSKTAQAAEHVEWAEMLAHKLAATDADQAAGRLTAAQAEGQRAILRIALGG